MWPQSYSPVSDSLGLSALVAALPIFTLLIMLGVLRKPAWISSLCGVGVAALVALFAYHMPASIMVSSALYGAAYGLLPIGWIVFTAILLYRLTVETGKFEIIKDSIASLTGDRRLQALLIAFAFGAFLEGAAGFGTPVAVASAMLAGLGFEPFFAAGICLLANTSPVAFGSIGVPIYTLRTVSGLPDLLPLSSDVGRICAPLALVVPSYLMLVMGGMKALKAVFPAAALCGITFAVTEFLVATYSGPDVAALFAAIVSMVALFLLMLVWKPAETVASTPHRHTGGSVFLAWSPYLTLVIFVGLWGIPSVKAWLDAVTLAAFKTIGFHSLDVKAPVFGWPGLHNLVQRIPPVVKTPSPYGAAYTLNVISASGTACLFSVLVSAMILRVSVGNLCKYIGATAKQLALPLLTISAMVALAYLMNYSGATTSLGLVIAGTGAAFPFFSPLLGWLGVFLTGSDTAANALFGSLQVVTANRLGLNPVLMAAANSGGGVVGKMISLQSIAVAAAATGMARSEEGRLFRFTISHSVFLAIVIGLLTLVYAYVVPGWVR
ncbi:MAG TPA: lactate permease LctP family transporter [Bryobacteraceae bacterium]|nr:lactate permease LctP family transporter [Bryobacteraceae bacterium]